MSPYIRSMLEDAADDGGRPVATDLNRIRSAGRRAVWRQRALVGGSALSATAVITAVAVVIGTAGSSPTDFVGSAGSALDAAGLNPALAPLIEAIEAAGYQTGLNGSDGRGMSASVEAAASGSEAATQGEVTTTAFALTRDDAVGAVVIAEFTAIAMLAAAPPPNGSPIDGPSTGPSCAVAPAAVGNAAFSWRPCDTRALNDGELWSSTGSGIGVDAVGVTLVRGDGSGFSITLGSAGGYAETGWFSFEPLPSTLPALSPLAELPLTTDELGDIVVAIAATGESIFPDNGPLPTAAPSPQPTMTPSRLPSGPDSPSDDCPDGVVLTELVDDLGRSALVEVYGRTYACSFGTEPGELVDVMDVTDWPPFGGSLEAWHFGLGSLTRCESTAACDTAVRFGVGPVPEGVARITFEMPDGQVTDAEIAAGTWMFRSVEPVQDPYDPAPIIVRAYDAAGALLVEGDAMPPPPPGPPPPPPTLPSGPPAP